MVPGSNHTTLPTLVLWKCFTCSNFIYQTCLFNENVIMITINNIFVIWLMFSLSWFHFHRSLLPFPASQTVFSIILGTELVPQHLDLCHMIWSSFQCSPICPCPCAVFSDTFFSFMCHFMTVFLHDVLAKRSEIYGKKLDFFVKKKKKKATGQ